MTLFDGRVLDPMEVAARMPARFLFLDIDGVLVNRRSLKERQGLRAVGDERCVRELNRVTDRTGAVLILSSAWRFCGLEEMRLILRHWGVTGDLVSMTPDLSKRTEAGLFVSESRGAEIAQWFVEHPHRVLSYAIVDDDADMGALTHRLVRTSFERGLTRQNGDDLIRLLVEA